MALVEKAIPINSIRNAILELTMNSFALRDYSLNVNHEDINE